MNSLDYDTRGLLKFLQEEVVNKGITPPNRCHPKSWRRHIK